jgi:hypothetical protein
MYAWVKNSMNDKDIDITGKGYDIYEAYTEVPFNLISVSNDK